MRLNPYFSLWLFLGIFLASSNYAVSKRPAFFVVDYSKRLYILESSSAGLHFREFDPSHLRNIDFDPDLSERIAARDIAKVLLTQMGELDELQVTDVIRDREGYSYVLVRDLTNGRFALHGVLLRPDLFVRLKNFRDPTQTIRFSNVKYYSPNPDDAGVILIDSDTHLLPVRLRTDEKGWFSPSVVLPGDTTMLRGAYGIPNLGEPAMFLLYLATKEKKVSLVRLRMPLNGNIAQEKVSLPGAFVPSTISTRIFHSLEPGAKELLLALPHCAKYLID